MTKGVEWERPYFSGRAGYQRRRHLPLPTGPQGLCSRNRIPYLGIMRAVLGGEREGAGVFNGEKPASINSLFGCGASFPTAGCPPTSYSDWGGDIFFYFFYAAGKRGSRLFCAFSAWDSGRTPPAFSSSCSLLLSFGPAVAVPAWLGCAAMSFQLCEVHTWYK